MLWFVCLAWSSVFVFGAACCLVSVCVAVGCLVAAVGAVCVVLLLFALYSYVLLFMWAADVFRLCVWVVVARVCGCACACLCCLGVLAS